ncbi:hypothetical protein Psuf_089450 [Phytohabitans suffuscus]|uniref:Abortive infection protein n=1 Tax=Phytohabitans suffuscus TaxID=624315 RepID=A0A6F8YZW3_9ACTN|nr:abortive phage infection protein [Phytohabitans suffuscus]BCB91632.1 hypothetical protein Psuf_089450 [Phytohabitans suffuscus]
MLAHDLRAIDERLRCNAVTVFGTHVDRLVQAATGALRRGLQVSIQPRLFDRPQEEILAHLARTARAAERLRRRHQPEVILIVGCEYLLFAPGIVPGETFLDRIRYLSQEQYDFTVFLRRLDALLDRAVAVARRHFGGRITYGAIAGAEQIDWSRFDIVGLDYYDYHEDRAGHTAALAPHRRWGKPIMILEFGCCTYEGAAQRGGEGWDIVDWESEPPRIPDGYVRSEREQADHLARMIGVFEAEGLLGAAPYTFVMADSPYSPNPRHDLDTAGYGLVKVIRRDFSDPASPYRWEPKLSFHAVAGAYRG